LLEAEKNILSDFGLLKIFKNVENKKNAKNALLFFL